MNNGTKQILYVAAPARNARFEADLTRLHPRWNVAVSTSASEALAKFQKTPFDAVVAHEHLADLDGFRLLDAIQHQHPATHRFIVADLTNAKTAVKSATIAHQCLPQPLDPDILRAALERVFHLSLWLSTAKVRDLLSRMAIVPSPPTLYLTIVRALRDPESDLEVIAAQAAQDPGLSARLLQVANSAALGLRHKVVTVQEAIGYLGLEMTRSLVLLAHTFAYCNRSKETNGHIDRLWQHSLRTGSLARRIAREEHASREMLDESFLAGLLHDIGELLLLVNLPKEYLQLLDLARASGTPLWQAESERFGVTHAELGAELMAMWNLPLTVVETLALHHHPSKLLSSQFGPLSAVHVADFLEQDFSNSLMDNSTTIDQQYLVELGLADRLEAWRDACRDELGLEAQ